MSIVVSTLALYAIAPKLVPIEDFEVAIQTCRAFAERCDITLTRCTAGFQVPGNGDNPGELIVQFGKVEFFVSADGSIVTSFKDNSRLEARRLRRSSDWRGPDLGETHALANLRQLATKTQSDRRFQAVYEGYYSDNAQGPVIPEQEHRHNATAHGRYRMVGDDNLPFFTLAGSFKLITDAFDGALLEYTAYAPGEVTSTEDRTGEAAARRIAESAALEHYGAGPEGATMELGYSDPRTEFPGNTYPKRPSGPTEIRLAWRWKLEKFSWNGRFVNLVVDVDAATGKILRTIPQPRDPRLDG